MSKNTKLWTAGTLKSRGWTEELIASLLPKPQRLYRNGRRVRAWRTDDIRRAEQSESFRSLRAASAENTESIPDDAALDAASQLLESAWDAAALPESREATLAARYHEAILRQIPAVGFAKRLRPGQSISYIEHFLHLETGTGAEPLGATLRRFVTAAPWLGANASFSARREALRALCRGAACDQRAGHCIFYRRAAGGEHGRASRKGRLSRAGAFAAPALLSLFGLLYPARDPLEPEAARGAQPEGRVPGSARHAAPFYSPYRRDEHRQDLRRV